jgi:hypothetical protein
MSLIKELANENLLYIALQGCRAVLEKELDIVSVIFSMSINVRQEIIRKARDSSDGLKIPYSYITLSSLAALKETQNNYAVQKHGIRFHNPGQRATTTKGYLFPITLGLEFHYIDSDPKRILGISQALVLLSLNKGLTFQIDVGEIFSFVVDLEIPMETTINIMDPNVQEAPGASDVTVQFIMHTTIGFFRDVSAVNGSSPTMGIKVSGSEPFTVDVPMP